MFDTLFGGAKASKWKKLISGVQCRLKFLKNKSNTIARLMRNDSAAFILSDRSEQSLHRIEQLYNDLTLVSVYEMLDEFCELISFNLSYILGNKDVGDDINEAVSSLIFASARCGNMPELGCIRNLFTQLYGQRFTMAAVELVPGNLVNDQIKEKLSRKPVPEDSMQKLFDEISRDCSTIPVPDDNEHGLSWNQVLLIEDHYKEIECDPIQLYDSEESLSISNSQSDATSISVSSSIAHGSSHDASESPIHDLYLDENRIISLEDWEERASTSSSRLSLDQFPEEKIVYLESRRKEQGSEDQRLVMFKPSQSHLSCGNWKPQTEELRTRHEQEHGAAVYDVLESDPCNGSSTSSPYPRPSFVHPKLPDYFDIAAKFMALHTAPKQNKVTSTDDNRDYTIACV